jgi:outer membrane protein, heavy metal efflux system
MKFHLRTVLVLMFATCIAHAAETATSSDVVDGSLLTLDAAVKQALAKAPALRARQAGLEAAQALTVSAGRLPDPELVIALDNLPVSGPDAYSTTDDFMTMRRVGVMQEFPASAKRRLRREQAQAWTSVANADITQARLDIAREVAEAWIRRATAESTLTELKSLVPEVELQASAAQAAVAAGRGSTTDALAAQAAVVRLAGRIRELEREVRGAVLSLAQWIDADAKRPLGPMPAMDALPTPPGALLATVHEHASLRPYEARAAAARVDIDLAKAERRPDWSAEFAFAKRGPDYSDMVTLEFRIGLPLSVKNRQDPVVASKSAELREIESDREAEVRMHVAELHQRLTDWEVLGEQLDLYDRELLPLSRERSRVALAAYRAGGGDLAAALEAFEQEAEARIEYASHLDQRGRVWAFLRYLVPQPSDQEAQP